MKKVLLFLFALLTTATVWAYEFTPLQMGENNGIELGPNDSDKGYLSFTPEVTDYYVISTTCAESHSMALNLWSDSLYYAWSEPDALRKTYRFPFLFGNQHVTELPSSIGNDLGTTLVPHSYPFCFALKERYRGAKVTTTLHIQQLFVLKFA